MYAGCPVEAVVACVTGSRECVRNVNFLNLTRSQLDFLSILDVRSKPQDQRSADAPSVGEHRDQIQISLSLSFVVLEFYRWIYFFKKNQHDQ